MVVKRLPEQFHWMNVTIPKAYLQPYIIVQYFGEGSKRFGQEYLTIEGRLKILDYVCRKQGWRYIIDSELAKADFVKDNEVFVVAKVYVIVETQDGVLVRKSAAYAAALTSDLANGIKKIETAALGRALWRMGIGLEAPQQASKQVEKTGP